MTTAALDLLVRTGSVVLISVAVLGFVFEGVAAGWRRNMMIGVLCGACAALTLVLTAPATGAPADGRLPFILLAGLLGGPIGAGASGLIALTFGVLAGTAPPFQAALATVIAACLGVGIRGLGALLAVPRGRTMAVCAALASPAAVAAYALPALSAGRATALAPLAAWTAFATLAGSLLAVNELSRGTMLRDMRRADRLRTRAGHAPREVFEGQIHHYWTLHERHGVDYAFLVVSIDDAAELEDRLGPDGWDHLMARSAATVRGTVRACDTCTAVDSDRFGVLLPHTTLAPARMVAERLRANLAEAGVSASIGAADAASTGGVTDVRAAAEAALYAALATVPRGAIGPPECAVEREAPRSFPSAPAAVHARNGSDPSPVASNPAMSISPATTSATPPVNPSPPWSG